MGKKAVGRAPLGDRRLNKRAIKIAEACLEKPDSSLPKRCGGWGDTKVAYRFFDSDNVTHEVLQERHNKNVALGNRLGTELWVMARF